MIQRSRVLPRIMPYQRIYPCVGRSGTDGGSNRYGKVLLHTPMLPTHVLFFSCPLSVSLSLSLSLHPSAGKDTTDGPKGGSSRRSSQRSLPECKFAKGFSDANPPHLGRRLEHAGGVRARALRAQAEPYLVSF